MNELRAIDRLDTGPRFTEQDAIRLNRMFRGAETEEWLRAVIEGSLAGDTAVVSSFGAESAVLLHLISQIDPNVPVLFLETGKHFPETLAYRDELTDRFGFRRIDLYPELADLKARPDLNGKVGEIMVGEGMPAITDPASGGKYTVKLTHGAGQGVTGRAQNNASTLRYFPPPGGI